MMRKRITFVSNFKIRFLVILIVLILVTSTAEYALAAVNKPSNLNIVGDPTTTSITLSWGKNNTASPIGYKIYRAEPIPNTIGLFGDYRLQLYNTTAIGGEIITYRNSTLSAGSFYKWSVIAINSEGSSINATTMAGTKFSSGTTNFSNPQNFQSGQTFGAGTVFASNQQFTGTQNFGVGTNFASGTKFANQQTFTGVQDFADSSLNFGSGTSFNTAQTFGNFANFTGAQTFTGSNIFGSGAKFGAGQTFDTTQTFGASTHFTAPITFATGQAFGTSTEFAKNQIFGAGAFDFTSASLDFGSGTIFGAARTFGNFANFTGAQTFTGSNIFKSATEFGAGQTFSTSTPQNFTKNISFGKNTNFGTQQIFHSGTKFDTGSIFVTNQPMPANVVLPTGLLLSSITCPDTSCTATSSQVLSSGEKLPSGTDPSPVSSAISPTDKSISIPGLGIEMTFSTVGSSGTVGFDLMDPAKVDAATPAVDGSLTMTASNGNSLHSLTSIVDISVNATSGASTSGAMTVTLPYDETTLGGVPESDLKMIHYTGGIWVEENSCTIDTIGNDITCTVTSLSPFGIGSSSSSSSGGSSGDSISPSIVTTFGDTDYPVFIGDTPYTAEQLKSPVLTKTVETGSPVKIKLLLYDNGGPQDISHVAMYVNRHGTTILNDLTETSLTWDKDKYLQISNPYGIISDGTVEQSIQANKALFTFDVTFAKEFEKSDILFVVWDHKRNLMQVLTEDALDVISSINVDTDISTPDATNVQPETDITSMPIETQGHMVSIKKWGGYDTESITDSQMLHDIEINADYMPLWVKKTAPWVVSNKITEQDFVNAIQYLHKKGIVN